MMNSYSNEGEKKRKHLDQEERSKGFVPDVARIVTSIDKEVKTQTAGADVAARLEALAVPKK